MIAIDTNLLVYAHRQDCEWHGGALKVLVELAESKQRWAIPWPCIHEFVAITTHPRIYDPPTPIEHSLRALRVWLTAPTCAVIGEGPGYFDVLSRLALSSKICGAMVHDARVAAICLHNGVSELWTMDRDFSRFPELRTVNPLL